MVSRHQPCHACAQSQAYPARGHPRDDKHQCTVQSLNPAKCLDCQDKLAAVWQPLRAPTLVNPALVYNCESPSTQHAVLLAWQFITSGKGVTWKASTAGFAFALLKSWESRISLSGTGFNLRRSMCNVPLPNSQNRTECAPVPGLPLGGQAVAHGGVRPGRAAYLPRSGVRTPWSLHQSCCPQMAAPLHRPGRENFY